jgi:hypothetical protein
MHNSHFGGSERVDASALQAKRHEGDSRHFVIADDML